MNDDKSPRKRRTTQPLLMMILVGISSCDDPSNSEKSADIQPNQDIVAAPKLEPLKKDLRVIGDGKIAAPRIDVEEVERLSPAQNAAEKNAAQTAKKKIRPMVFTRPLVLSINALKSGDTRIELRHVFGPAPGDQCASQEGDWPCGNFAKSSLQRFVRTRSISCEGDTVGPDQFTGDCAIGKTDLATWLLEQGWAKTENAKFIPLMNKAKENRKGIWRE